MSDEIKTRPATDAYREGWERTFAQSRRAGKTRMIGKHWLDGRCESCGHKHDGRCSEPVGDGCNDDDRPHWKACGCDEGRKVG